VPSHLSRRPRVADQNNAPKVAVSSRQHVSARTSFEYHETPVFDRIASHGQRPMSRLWRVPLTTANPSRPSDNSTSVGMRQPHKTRRWFRNVWHCLVAREVWATGCLLEAHNMHLNAELPATSKVPNSILSFHPRTPIIDHLVSKPWLSKWWSAVGLGRLTSAREGNVDGPI
jgi:hypothetical protein